MTATPVTTRNPLFLTLGVVWHTTRRVLVTHGYDPDYRVELTFRELAAAAGKLAPDPFAAGDGADAHYLRLWAELVFKLRRRGLRPVCGSHDVDVQPLAARPRGAC